MEPRIEVIDDKKLVGKRIRTTLSENRTVELWQSFMSKRKEITNSVSPDLFSVEIYDSIKAIESFNSETKFEKWAAIEVSDFSHIPYDMETCILKGGHFAVYTYKGDPRSASDTFKYIFGTWLPDSGYMLDNRPHFEIMGEKYKNNDPDSEEEFWIPISIRR